MKMQKMSLSLSSPLHIKHVFFYLVIPLHNSEANSKRSLLGCSAMGRYTTDCLPQLPSTFVSHAFWMTEPSGGARAKGICSLFAVDIPTSTI